MFFRPALSADAVKYVFSICFIGWLDISVRSENTCVTELLAKEIVVTRGAALLTACVQMLYAHSAMTWITYSWSLS
jgi:hypothetical protein